MVFGDDESNGVI